MSNDRLIKFNIEKARKIINRIDNFFAVPKLYSLLFKYIEKQLQPDFERQRIVLKIDSQKYKKIDYANKVWVMWWQGFKKAPKIVQNNICNLKNIFGKDNVILITKDNYKNYATISKHLEKKLDNNRISVTTWSDIVRFNILKERGGIWIDSTVAISAIFKEYLESVDSPFFTLSNIDDDYHWISNSDWTIWLIGGVAHFELFEYICDFYNSYFEHHEESIDYFLTDDIIHEFYVSSYEFRMICQKLQKEKWEKYYLYNNFATKYNKDIYNKFKTQLLYSVQKLTYKNLNNLLQDKSNLLSHIMYKGYKE